MVKENCLAYALEITVLLLLKFFEIFLLSAVKEVPKVPVQNWLSVFQNFMLNENEYS
jgi:hypothetical protein